MITPSQAGKLEVEANNLKANKVYTFSLSTSSFEAVGMPHAWPILKKVTAWQTVINTDYAFHYPECKLACLDHDGRQIPR